VRSGSGWQSRLRRAPRTVVGYHGCSRETAERIVAGEPFLPSTKEYDWLGSGIYFWEYGPFRAYEWAEKRFGAEAAVMAASIRLGRCLNLLDIEHQDELKGAFDRAALVALARGVVLPRNRDDGRYFLDQFVLEFYCQLREQEQNRPLQTVRACYPEGEPVYPGSRILSHTHVQLAVRDVSCISHLRRVR
jgi:hypothetical protein